MPATPIAAVLYVFLLMPGLIFLVRVEAHRPKRGRTVFRETATVVFASVLSAGAVVGLVLLLSIWWKAPIDGLAAFTLNPINLFTNHPRAVLTSMLCFLMLAGLVAWVGGSEKAFELWSSRVVWAGTSPRVQQGTAWQEILYAEDENTEVLVGVQLKSGSWLQGVHAFHSDVETEDGDRALVLQGPLHFRYDEGQSLKDLEDYDRLVVQSSEIEYLVAIDRGRGPVASGGTSVSVAAPQAAP